MPVVVNISQGMNAGAHDGRSALELGFEHFSDGGRMPGRVVVKSAGNERDKRRACEGIAAVGSRRDSRLAVRAGAVHAPAVRAVVAVGQQIQLQAVGATAVGAVENSGSGSAAEGSLGSGPFEPILKSKGSSRARDPTE